MYCVTPQMDIPETFRDWDKGIEPDTNRKRRNIDKYGVHGGTNQQDQAVEDEIYRTKRQLSIDLFYFDDAVLPLVLEIDKAGGHCVVLPQGPCLLMSNINPYIEYRALGQGYSLNWNIAFVLQSL